MPDLFFQQLPMFRGGGRHVLHDPASRGYDAADLLSPRVRRPLVSRYHTAAVPPWDLYAALRAKIGRDPIEYDAQALYELETRLDDTQIPGHWPPTDTGSTGLWSAKALRRHGLIGEYRHCFRLATVLQVLQQRPVSLGLPWYQSMLTPDSDGMLQVYPAAGLAGGHQVAAVGYDAELRRVQIRNSWGEGWGQQGHAWLRLADLDELLAEQGDAVVFLPAGGAR